MPRKLLHSVRALGVSLSLVTAGLIMAALSPTSVAPGRDAFASAAGAAPVIAPAVAVDPSVQVDPFSTPAAPTAPAQAQAPRRPRQAAHEAMALPFFSFAQGLRRSKRN